MALDDAAAGAVTSVARRLIDEFDLPTIRMTDAQGSLEPVDSVPDTLASGRRALRRKTMAGLGVLALCAVVSLFVDPGRGFFSPAEVGACYELWFSQVLAALVAPFDVIGDTALSALHADYFRILDRVGETAKMMLCGAAAAAAGLLFQTAFRERFAALPIAGASSVAGLGDALLVAALGAALVPSAVRWVVGACLAAVCAFAAVYGAKRSTRLVSFRVRAWLCGNRAILPVVATVYLLAWGLWGALSGAASGFAAAPGPGDWAVLVMACAIGTVVSIALRFRINGLVFSDDDVRQLGIDASRLRVVAIGCAAILLSAAQVFAGPVGLLALAAPAVSRKVFGIGFRTCLIGSALIGAATLVSCSFTGLAAVAANGLSLAGIVALRGEWPFPESSDYVRFRIV